MDFDNYQHLFHIMEDYGDNPNAAPSEPLRIFFGRQIGRGQRHLIKQYAVKERHFIGNTSMDAQLSFIMANQAKVSGGRFLESINPLLPNSLTPLSQESEWLVVIYPFIPLYSVKIP